MAQRLTKREKAIFHAGCKTGARNEKRTCVCKTTKRRYK